MPHGQLCEGDSNIHPDGQLGMSDDLNNCGGDDIYRCIRGNQKFFFWFADIEQINDVLHRKSIT